MNVQYISDTQGRHTAVVIPIEEWNSLTEKYQELGKSKPNAARFKGLLTKEEADKYHTYLNQARTEWDRGI